MESFTVERFTRKMPDMHAFRAAIVICAFASTAAVNAATAYRCVAADGALSFQDVPCASGSRQSKLALPDSPPPSIVDTRPRPEAAPLDATPPSQPAVAHATPPPSFYLCTRYDGNRYISDDGRGGSAAVPLGVLGVPQRGLADAYGGTNGIGVSAPGLRTIPHVAATSVPFGGTYTWIDDECHAATPREACAYLRTALDDVTAKLRRSFSDTESQLKAQQADIERRMRGC